MTREDDLEAALRQAIEALHQVNATLLKSPAVQDTIWLANDSTIGTTLYDYVANEIREARRALK